jgi:hypothetical protein
VYTGFFFFAGDETLATGDAVKTPPVKIVVAVPALLPLTPESQAGDNFRTEPTKNTNLSMHQVSVSQTSGSSSSQSPSLAEVKKPLVTTEPETNIRLKEVPQNLRELAPEEYTKSSQGKLYLESQ